MPRQGRNKGQITAENQVDLAAGDVALGAGWGNSATKAITTGANDLAGQIVVTSAGTGQSQATATITITFKSAFATAPRAVLIANSNDNAIDTGHTTYTVSTTSLVITFNVLPVATKIYKFDYVCIA